MGRPFHDDDVFPHVKDIWLDQGTLCGQAGHKSVMDRQDRIGWQRQER